MPQITTIHTLFAASDAGQVPEWVHVCPAGTFRGRDGRGPYFISNVDAVIAESMREGAGRLVIDENHSTDRAMQAGGAAPAVGWVVALEARDSGLWGRVEWTRHGQQLMADKAYRGLSPAISVEVGTGQVHAVLRASLTNVPNFDLVTLHDKGTGMDFHAQLRAALGLSDSADEAAIVTAASARHTAVSTHSAQLGEIATAAGVAGKGVTEIVSAIKARGAGETELERKVIALQSQLGTMQQTAAKALAETVVDAAIKAGKPIKPLRDRYVSRHMQDPEGVKAELEALPSIHAGGVTAPPQGGASAEGLTADETRICELMGISADAFKKQKAAQGQEIV